MTTEVQQVRPINLAPFAFIGVIAAVLVVGAWVVVNTPGVSTELAKTECLKLANENTRPGLYSDIRVMDTWAKNGKRVVELGYFDDRKGKSYTSRVCVVDTTRIQMVSMFENWMWRQ